MGLDPSTSIAVPAFEPLAVTRKEAMRMIAMPKLLQRWLYYRWVEVVRPGGRGCKMVIDYQSLKNAYCRFKNGEQPPLLPSELTGKTTRR